MKKRIPFYLAIAWVFMVGGFDKPSSTGLVTAQPYQGFLIDADSAAATESGSREGSFDPLIILDDEKLACTKREIISSEPTQSENKWDVDVEVLYSCEKDGNELTVSIYLTPIAFFQGEEFFYSYYFSDTTYYEKVLNMYQLEHTYVTLIYPLMANIKIYELSDQNPWYTHTEEFTCSYWCTGTLCLNGDLEGKCCDEVCTTNQDHCKYCPHMDGYAHCPNVDDACNWNGRPDYEGVSCCVPGTPECAGDIDVQGNGVSIPNHDVTPSTIDGTDFGVVDVPGSPVTHTFTIENTGILVLNLTDSDPQKVTVTGEGFSLETDATTPIISDGGTTAFVVAFSPSTTGLFTGMVSIDNDDPDENPYTFKIRGSVGTPFWPWAYFPLILK